MKLGKCDQLYVLFIITRHKPQWPGGSHGLRTAVFLDLPGESFISSFFSVFILNTILFCIVQLVHIRVGQKMAITNFCFVYSQDLKEALSNTSEGRELCKHLDKGKPPSSKQRIKIVQTAVACLVEKHGL